VPANSTFNAGASTAGWLCAPEQQRRLRPARSRSATSPAAVANHTATFAVTVPNPAPVARPQIANTANPRRRWRQRHRPHAGQQLGQRHHAGSGAPDLSLTKSDGGASVAPGGSVRLHAHLCQLRQPQRVRRGADRDRTGEFHVQPAPVPPAGSARRTTTPARPCTLAVGNVAAAAGNQTATFTVTGLPRNPLPGGVAQIANTASISDDGTNGSRPAGTTGATPRRDHSGPVAGPRATAGLGDTGCHASAWSAYDTCTVRRRGVSRRAYRPRRVNAVVPSSEILAVLALGYAAGSGLAAVR